MPPATRHPGVEIDEVTSRPPIAGAATTIAAFIGRTRHGPINIPVAITAQADFDAQFGGLWQDSPLSFAVRDYFLNGGRDAIILRLPDPQPNAGTALAALRIGLQALANAGRINLLCLPPRTRGGSIAPALIDAAIAWCTAHRAMMIVDPPAGWRSADDALAGIAQQVGAASANAAVFFPRLLQANPLRRNQRQTFVPCGAVAGTIARLDVLHGVWKAPSGVSATLANVAGLSVPLRDQDQARLNPRAINMLREGPGHGQGSDWVVWGARTRRGDDQLADPWKYIPVRRTALFIEDALWRGLQWAVLEPNDEPLWAAIRRDADAFMDGLFARGAFQGRTPREAWFVKCGRDTTSPADIANGIVTIIIGFAPLRPAEFVTVQIRQHTAQAAA